jgi:CBS domain-containing protein
MNGKIRDLMTKEVVSVHPDDTLLTAAQQMKSHDIGSMPVCGEMGTVVGTITDRDITIRAIAEGMDPSQTRVDSIMTRNVVCAQEDLDVDEAVDLMERYRVRRLPVVDKERHLRGLFTFGKVARTVEKTEAEEEEAIELFRSVTEPPIK